MLAKVAVDPHQEMMVSVHFEDLLRRLDPRQS